MIQACGGTKLSMALAISFPPKLKECCLKDISYNEQLLGGPSSILYMSFEVVTLKDLAPACGVVVCVGFLRNVFPDFG